MSQKFLLKGTYAQKVNLDTSVSSGLLGLHAPYNLVKFLW